MPRKLKIIYLSLVICFCFARTGEANKTPVKIGISAEFGHLSSTSAEAIRFGILTAIDEINEAGGVLNGRPLQLVSRDNRSVPARGVADIEYFAQDQEVVAVFGGKFSPVMLDMVERAHQLSIPVFSPWATADQIIDNGHVPNYAFRMSLKDSWAIPAMLDFASERGQRHIGLLLPNNAWGRSSEQAARWYFHKNPDMKVSKVIWFNSGERHFEDKYGALVASGADVILMITNEAEGISFAEAAYAYSEELRVPLIAHWGVTGGEFDAKMRAVLTDIDLSVAKTFTFKNRNDTKSIGVLERTKKLFGIVEASEIFSPVGFAHAYDLTHILAKAVNIAQTTDRAAIRSALEEVRNYEGLIKFFKRPFSQSSHEALRASDLFLGRFSEEGRVVPIIP